MFSGKIFFNRRFFNHLFVIVLLLAPVMLWATTYYSQGSDDFGVLGNWNTASDGSGTSPSAINSTDDFIIQDGHTITADADYTINSLTVQSGGTFDGGGYTMTLNGDFTMDGSMTDGTYGSCNFTFAGSGAQYISGTGTIEFYNLTFSGSGTYYASANFAVYVLTLSSGTFNAGSRIITVIGTATTVFNKTGGTFDAGTSTFQFNTIGNQTISSDADITFYNLEHSPSLSRSLTLSGDVQYTISNKLIRGGSSSSIILDNTTTLDMSGATVSYEGSTNKTVSAEWPLSTSLAPAEVDIVSGITITADPGAGNVLSTNNMLINASGASLSIASGTVQINSQLTITDGSISESGGTFAWGSGTTTLVYNGGDQQTVGPEWSATVAPTNVQVNNSSTSSPALDLGTANLSGLAGNLTLTLGSVDYSASSLELTVSGNVVGGSGSFGTVNNNTLNVNGASSAVTSSGQASFYNVNFTSSGGTLGDVTISGTLTINPGAGNTATLTGPVTLDTNAGLTVASGTLNLNGQQITKNGSNTLTLAAGTQLTTGGSSFEGFATYTLDPSSTILLNGTASEDIPTGISYGNIQINKSAGSAIATGSGAITLQDNADLTITAGTFDLAGLSLVLGDNSDIDVQGGTADLNGGTLTITTANTNTLTVASGATLATGGTSLDGFDTYTANGTVVFDGSTAETIPAGMTTFNNITINNGANVTASADISVSGVLTLSLGTFTPATATLTGTLTTNGGNFSSSSGTVVFAGTAAQAINGSSAVTFYNFTINNANGVTLGHNITVDGTLTLTSGVIGAGSYVLSMGTGAAFSGGSSSSYVEGRVAKTFAQGSSADFTFQTGKGGEYLPVGVAFTDVSGSDYTVTVEQYNSDPHTAVSSSIDNTTLSGISSIRYWLIEGSGGTPANLQVTLSWNSNDGVSVPGALDVAQYNGTQWISVGGDGVGDATGGTIQSDVITTSGNYFALGDDANNGQDNSLPVTLATFAANASFDKVILTWKTESEVDNMGFNVYRKSKDDRRWTKINPNLIAGAGNSSVAHEYEFVDRNVAAGEEYSYRLESVSFTGHTETFDQMIKTVQVPVPTEFAVLPNYPNPFNPETTLRFQLPEQERISILIYDLKGNLVKHLVNNQTFAPGMNQVKWNATNDANQTVSSGTYVYRLIGQKHSKIGKMIYLR